MGIITTGLLGYGNDGVSLFVLQIWKGDQEKKQVRRCLKVILKHFYTSSRYEDRVASMIRRTGCMYESNLRLMRL